MNREELYEIMDEILGYAYVYEKENNNQHTDYMFSMIPENIANFIGKNTYTVDKVILTDMCERLIVESIYGGFIMNCPNQKLYRNIIPHFAPIQQCEIEPKDFPVATRGEMEELWNKEEMSVMETEISIL